MEQVQHHQQVELSRDYLNFLARWISLDDHIRSKFVDSLHKLKSAKKKSDADVWTISLCYKLHNKVDHFIYILSLHDVSFEIGDIKNLLSSGEEIKNRMNSYDAKQIICEFSNRTSSNEFYDDVAQLHNSKFVWQTIGHVEQREISHSQSHSNIYHSLPSSRSCHHVCILDSERVNSTQRFNRQQRIVLALVCDWWMKIYKQTFDNTSRTFPLSPHA